jgi:tRNA (cmo5U34)-methyltransferase
MKRIEDFKFSRDVVQVFDDMVDRSVPFYSEVQRMITEMSESFLVDGTNVYDLGCSTGTTLGMIGQHTQKDVTLIGYDNAPDMLDRAREKLSAAGLENFELREADLNTDFEMENASLVLMILTLQFVRPLHRESILKKIHASLNENGCLILFEKVLGEDSLFNRLFIDFYYDMKRRHGYSEMEISQKREALENVLIPYRHMENREMLQRCGFQHVDTFFKWYNFCAMVAVK